MNICNVNNEFLEFQKPIWEPGNVTESNLVDNSISCDDCKMIASNVRVK